MVDSRELEGLEPKKVTEVSLPDDPTEFAEMIGGGINSLRSSVSNLSARAYNVLISDRVRNKYEVDESGYLNLVTGVPKETTREKIVNSVGDLTTIGLAAARGPEGMLMAQGGKATILRTLEEAKTTLKSLNGNSKASSKAQHTYDILDTQTGKYVKTGISGGKLNANGTSRRANSQANRWNKLENSPGRFKGEVTNKIPAGKGARAKALDLEKKRAKELIKNGQLTDPKKHVRPR